MYAVDVRESHQLDELRPAWDQLLERCALPTPFLTVPWLTTWQQCVAADARLMVLCVWQGSALRALLPLARREAAVLQPVLTFAGMQDVGADHADLICAPSDAEPCMRAILAFLRAGGLAWRELRLPLVAEDSPLLRHLQQLGGGQVVSRRVSRAPYIPLAKSYDAFLAGLSGNERYKLRQRTRKLLDERGAAYVAYGPAQHAQALAALFRLHRLRAAEKAMRSAFDAPVVERFHSRLLSVLPPEHIVLRGLEIDDRPIAMFYGFRLAGRLYYFQLGYDPAWSACSPGIVLITKTIEEACATGCLEYNFLQGDEPFKQTWTRQGRALFDLVVYKRSLSGVVARQAAHAVARVKSAVRPVAVAVGLAREAAAGPAPEAAVGSVVVRQGGSNG